MNIESRFPDVDVLRFRFRVIQLSRRGFVRQSNPVASALMARMGMAPEDRPRVKLECLRLLVTLRLDPARMRLISGFIDMYLRLNPEERLLFQQQPATLLQASEKSSVMELTTSWKEEGIEIGIEKGREQECQLILRQLEKRFGPLEPDWEARIRQFSFEQLGQLGVALLDFTRRTDLKDWLAAH